MTVVDTLRGNTSLVAAVLIYTILFCIYTTWRKPISRIPGPWYSKWTSLVLTYHWLKGNRTYYVHSLHQEYGNVVRVGPNEVSTSTVEGAKIIFNLRETFVKSQFYRDISMEGDQTIFTTADVAFNRRQRRLLGASMMDSNVRSFEKTVNSLLSLTMKRVDQEMEERGAADVLKWWMFFATDVIGELTFGESFRTLEQGKPSAYTTDMNNIAEFGGIRATFPRLISWTSMMPFGIFERAREGTRNVAKYVSEALSRHQHIIDTDPEVAAHTLFAKMSKAKDEDQLTMNELCGAARTYLIAGTDTTAITLTYLVWAVCQRPAIKVKLVQELQTLPKDYTDADLRELPYLRCVIEETLRLHNPAPAALPRVVPPDGAEIAGHHLEQGTIVSAQAYTIHRDESIFSQAEEFNPERWQNPTKQMKEASAPFGRGPRACLGIHLAWLELRLATAKFFITFPQATVSEKEGMAEEAMKPKMYLLIKPSGGQCLIERK